MKKRNLKDKCYKTKGMKTAIYSDIKKPSCKPCK